MSFIDSNLQWLKKNSFGIFIPQDPESITDTNNIDDEQKTEAEPSNTTVGSKRKKYVFKKKLYLQYNNKNLKNIDESHKKWVKDILLNNKYLMENSQLFSPEYHKSEDKENSKINIENLFTASSS